MQASIVLTECEQPSYLILGLRTPERGDERGERQEEVTLMRRILLIFAAVGALAAAGVAAATVLSVSITGNGFSPQTVTVTRGDPVRWSNTDTSRHRIMADDRSFSSPTLAPGDRYSLAFPNGGTFRYHDAFDTTSKGIVVVNPQPQPQQPAPSVGLSASRSVVVFGGSTRLSGSISSKEPGDGVTVVARRFGRAAFSPLATVTTGDGGFWSYVARPSILTTYQVRWKGTASSTATIQVRPRVTFRVLVGRRFLAKVTAARSFTGHVVNFQRRRLGTWITVRHVRLGPASTAVFRAALPHGTSSLRVVITKTHAGAGYLAGISRTIVYHLA
jgi:plastocyanin